MVQPQDVNQWYYAGCNAYASADTCVIKSYRDINEEEGNLILLTGEMGRIVSSIFISLRIIREFMRIEQNGAV